MRNRTINKHIWLNETEDNLLKEKYKKDFQKVSDFIVDIQEMYLNTVRKEFYGYY